MIAFAGILLLCMLAQMARFCTRAYASLGEAKRPAPLRDDPLPPLSAINSATFLTGKAQLRARSRRTVGGGGLLQGWFLRKGEVTALMTPRSDQEPESAKGNPLVTSGFPVAQSGLARFVPPSHVQPPLEHLPWSRYLTFTPFSISWLPKPFASTLNIPQIVIVLLYLAVCLTALLWKADNTAPLPGKPEGPDYRRTGTVALVNIPVAVALGVRGNLIGMVIGRGYEKLKTFHKIAGRVCFITATIHIAYFGWYSLARLLQIVADKHHSCQVDLEWQDHGELSKAQVHLRMAWLGRSPPPGGLVPPLDPQAMVHPFRSVPRHWHTPLHRGDRHARPRRPAVVVSCCQSCIERLLTLSVSQAVASMSSRC